MLIPFGQQIPVVGRGTAINYEALLGAHLSLMAQMSVDAVLTLVKRAWLDRYALMPSAQGGRIFPHSPTENDPRVQTKILILGDNTDPEADDSSRCFDHRPIGIVAQIFGKDPDLDREDGYLSTLYWTHPLWENTDKGHFIGASLGARPFSNIFPQRSELNQGHSFEGKVFRAMESTAGLHRGSWVLASPIYEDGSDRPAIYEYVVVLPDGRIWSNVFDNRPEGPRRSLVDPADEPTVALMRRYAYDLPGPMAHLEDEFLAWMQSHQIAVDRRDGQGQSLIHQACSAGHARVVQELLRLGSSANRATQIGWTPLHYAVLGWSDATSRPGRLAVIAQLRARLRRASGSRKGPSPLALAERFQDQLLLSALS